MSMYDTELYSGRPYVHPKDLHNGLKARGLTYYQPPGVQILECKEDINGEWVPKRAEQDQEKEEKP